MGWVQPQPNPTQQPYYWTKRTISPTDPSVGLKSKEYVCLFGAQVNQVTWVGGIHWFPHLKDDSCLHSIERTRRNKEWMTAIRIGNQIDLTLISNPQMHIPSRTPPPPQKYHKDDFVPKRHVFNICMYIYRILLPPTLLLLKS